MSAGVRPETREQTAQSPARTASAAPTRSETPAPGRGLARTTVGVPEGPAYTLAISPDIHVRHLSDWYLLAARLSRSTGLRLRASYFDGFTDLRRGYAEGAVDLVVANAADTVALVRGAGFTALARPAGVSDEAVVVVAADGPARSVQDLTGPLRVAATDAPDVECIGRILLEPADLADGDLVPVRCRNYTLVAKAVRDGRADAGFLLRAAYDELSAAVRDGLRPLVSSHIYVLGHALLAGPSLAAHAPRLLDALERLCADPSARDLLAGVGAPHGWERLTAEDVHFLLDLMSALTAD